MFQPVLPASGLTGWYFLQRTAETQKETLAQSGQVKRESDYFRENISKVQTAADLVDDRTLLRVALTAYGLEADIDNKFFIQRILEGDTNDDGSLSNQLSDKRYLAFAVGMGLSGGGLGLESGAVETLIDDFQTRSFETAVGEQDPNLRLALSVERDLGAIAENDTSQDTKWFAVMGNPPLRKIFESALGFSSSFGSLPIDQQLDALKDRSQNLFETSDIADFTSLELQENLTRQFLLREQISATGFLSGRSIALTLLQS